MKVKPHCFLRPLSPSRRRSTRCQCPNGRLRPENRGRSSHESLNTHRKSNELPSPSPAWLCARNQTFRPPPARCATSYHNNHAERGTAAARSVSALADASFRCEPEQPFLFVCLSYALSVASEHTAELVTNGAQTFILNDGGIQSAGVESRCAGWGAVYAKLYAHGKLEQA